MRCRSHGSHQLFVRFFLNSVQHKGFLRLNTSIKPSGRMYIEKKGIENVERYARKHGYTDASTREQLGKQRVHDFLRKHKDDAGRSRKDIGGVRGDQTEAHGLPRSEQPTPEALSGSETALTEQPTQASETSGAFIF